MQWRNVAGYLPDAARASLVEEGQSVRVHVDSERCQGHNRCHALAPELFEIDEYGYSSELNEGLVPEELEEKAHLAVANCPEYAISISE
jgi:ferredoxin